MQYRVIGFYEATNDDGDKVVYPIGDIVTVEDKKVADALVKGGDLEEVREEAAPINENVEVPVEEAPVATEEVVADAPVETTEVSTPAPEAPKGGWAGGHTV